MARVYTGLANILSRLARFFRLGQFGHAEPGTQQPARPRLRTAEQIVAELRAELLLPTPAQGARWAWSYICVWYDTETNQRLGRAVAHVVYTDAGASYQLAAAEARRMTLYPEDLAASPPPPTPGTAYLRCRRIGQPLIIPTS
jgi:hypothetical protein